MEIIRHRLESIGQEMAEAFRNSCRSPGLIESGDFALGLVDPQGSLATLATSLPQHILCARETARSMLQELGFELENEDIIIGNDPYAGGSHLPDVTMLMPLFSQGEPLLFPLARAHVSDIGAARPGGLHPQAYEIYQEGLRIPPVFLHKAGRPREDVHRKLLKNSRTPADMDSTLAAMVAALRVGARRITELVQQQGREPLFSSLEAILAYTERLMRAEISRLPQGIYSGEARCDTDFQGAKDVKVQVSLTVSSQGLSLDFSGSHPQVKGFINSTLYNTAAFSLAALLAYLGQSARGGSVNDGLLRPLHIAAPEGSVVNPLFPAPVGWSSQHVGGQVAEAVTRALLLAWPDPEYRGTTPSHPQVILFGTRPANGRCPSGSLPYIDTSGANLASIEMWEVELPLRIDSRELLPDSGGAGTEAGYPGIRVIETILDDRPTVTAFTQGLAHPARGLAGGRDGSRNRVVLKYGQAEEILVAPIEVQRQLSPGDRLLIEVGGGGGSGEPEGRDPELVRQDVADGYISIEAARREYGVIIDRKGSTLLH